LTLFWIIFTGLGLRWWNCDGCWGRTQWTYH